MIYERAVIVFSKYKSKRSIHNKAVYLSCDCSSVNCTCSFSCNALFPNKESKDFAPWRRMFCYKVGVSGRMSLAKGALLKR